MPAYVYIMASKRNGTIYIGVTKNLRRRIYEHREGIYEGFSKKYQCKLLVWYEGYEEIIPAIQREKNLKHWPRDWKLELIEKANPKWDDLYETLGW